jgi:5-methylcytosine-specific restriction endonuclease McrBC regulatory subunit McrC
LERAARSLDTDAFSSVRQHFNPIASWFGPVSEEPITSSDFQKARLGRTSRYYRRALSWARIIVQGMDLPATGGIAPPLAFDAEDVFERFARVVVRSALPTSAHRLMPPEREYPFLQGAQDQNRKPDIVVSNSKGVHAVGDAKYKEVVESPSDEQASNVIDMDVVRSRINSSDWNQLYVYMRLTQASRGFFIVPFWEEGGDASALIDRYEFSTNPVDGPVRVAVLGLNLMQPIRHVKQHAASRLRDWLLVPLS